MCVVAQISALSKAETLFFAAVAMASREFPDAFPLVNRAVCVRQPREDLARRWIRIGRLRLRVAFVLSNSLDGTKRNAAATDDPPGSTAWQCQEGIAIMEYDRPWQLQVRTIGSLPTLLRQNDDGSQLRKLDVKVITYLALGRVAEIGPGCRCSSYFGHGHGPGAKWLNPQGQQGSLDSCLIRRCAHVASMFIDA